MAEERTIECSKNGMDYVRREVILLKIDNSTRNAVIFWDTGQPPGGKSWEQYDSLRMEKVEKLVCRLDKFCHLPKGYRPSEALIEIGWKIETWIALELLCSPALHH